MVRAILLTQILFNLGCSNLSQNIVKDGEYIFREGRFKEKTWDSDLILKRTSWLQGLTLLFDSLTTRVAPESPFYAWFSDDEKEKLASCQDYFLASYYSIDNKRASSHDFQSQIEKYGYDRVSIPVFESNFRNHPDFIDQALQLYITKAYCRKGPARGNWSIHFSGFRPASVLP